MDASSQRWLHWRNKKSLYRAGEEIDSITSLREPRNRINFLFTASDIIFTTITRAKSSPLLHETTFHLFCSGQLHRCGVQIKEIHCWVCRGVDCWVTLWYHRQRSTFMLQWIFTNSTERDVSWAFSSNHVPILHLSCPLIYCVCKVSCRQRQQASGGSDNKRIQSAKCFVSLSIACVCHHAWNSHRFSASLGK